MSAEDLTDHQLMSQLALGQLGALDVLVKRYQQRVFSLAFRMLGDWHSAEDVAQDTFIRLYNSAPTYKPQAKLITFIYPIVINLCRDYRQKSSRFNQFDEQTEIISNSQSPVSEFIRKEQAIGISQAVAALPERQKTATLLHRFDGLSHSEIAQIMGISISAAESLLVRAYAALRESLKKI